MNTLKTTTRASALLGTSSAFAADQCPDYLPAALMADCSVETGAGGQFNAEQKYKEWRKTQAKKLEALDDYTGTTTEPVAQYVVGN